MMSTDFIRFLEEKAEVERKSGGYPVEAFTKFGPKSYWRKWFIVLFVEILHFNQRETLKFSNIKTNIHVIYIL